MSPALHMALDAILVWPGMLAWPSQALQGQPNFSQTRQSRLVCITLPFARHEAHVRTPMIHELQRSKGIGGGGRGCMCLPARMARECHLTSCSVNTLLSHGPEGHVLGCGVGEKVSLHFDKAFLYQGRCSKIVKTFCN